VVCFVECMCMWSKQEEKWKMTPETHTAAEWQHSSIILCDLQRKRVCCRCLTVKWIEAKAPFHISQMTLACQRRSGTDRWLICEVCHLDADYPLLWAAVSPDSLRWPGLMAAGNTFLQTVWNTEIYSQLQWSIISPKLKKKKRVTRVPCMVTLKLSSASWTERHWLWSCSSLPDVISQQGLFNIFLLRCKDFRETWDLTRMC